MSRLSPTELKKRAEERKLAKVVKEDSNTGAEQLNEGSDLFNTKLDETITNNSNAENAKTITPIKESATAEEIDVLLGNTSNTAEASLMVETEEIDVSQVEIATATTNSIVEVETTTSTSTVNIIQEAPKNIVDVITPASLADTNAFKNLTQNSETTGLGVGGGYTEVIENNISRQCQISGVKNLDLASFGIRAQNLKFTNLSVLTYGNHKFLGAPFTEEEEYNIVMTLALHVAQSPESKIVIRAVQEVKDENGMIFHSLLFNDVIAQKFANISKYVVHANINESDVSKLILVVQK